MARNMYGATSADFTITSGGRVIPGAELTLWTARTGGTQITDLLDRDSVACTTVTSAADGSVVYYGPNNDKTVHWADSGQGSRVAIRPVDITGEPPTLTVGTVTTGTADVTISGTSPDYDIDFVLPPVGTNGVNTAAIQDSAVTSAKIADGTITSTDVAASTFAAFGTQGNLLTANQASGTGALGDTTGFATTGTTIESSTTVAAQGTRSLKVTCAHATATSNRVLIGGSPTVGTLAVSPSATYTVQADLRTATGTELFTATIYFWTSAGNVAATTAYVSSQQVSATDSAWATLRYTFTTPADCAFISLRFNPIALVAPGVFYMDRFSFHKGASGQWSMPGVPIVGGSHIATNGAVHLSGTGVPEGVVTAAPGSTWLQTDSTVDVKGWIRWVKATGTGNTGWVAGPEADTGWRDVSADLENGWTGSLLVRRIGNRVYANGAPVSAGNGAIYTLPSAFLPTQLSAYYPCGATRSATDGSVALWTVTSTVFIYQTSGHSYRLSAQWLTPASWPTSLPGSAA